MPEEILLFSWEIKCLSEHLDNIRHDLASLLEKAGFKKNGDWNNGFFTVTSAFDKGRYSSTLTLDLKSKIFLRNAPIRELIDYAIRRYDEQIISVKSQKGPALYGRED
jgi:hypothetical protein